MRTRLGICVLAVALIAPACGSSTPTAPPVTPATSQAPGQPTPTEGPQGTSTQVPQATVAQPSSTSTVPQPTDSGPLPTQSPEEPLAPLPGPELGSASDIAQVMYDPSYAEVAVVSMLDQLGIGLYQPDGTPIRKGLETSDRDLYLFEPEARGLIDMLVQATDEQEAWISFRDFHAALAGLGFQGSAEDLAQAYADAYAAQPDAPISQFVNGLTTINIDAPMPLFTAWLLLVDGFVPESGTTGPTALADTGLVSDVAVGPGPRVAAANVQALSNVPLAVDPLIIAHLIVIVRVSVLNVFAMPNAVHEGHGGPGPSVDVYARLHTIATAFTSPFSGASIVPVTTSPSAIDLQWDVNAPMHDHGTLTSADAVTNALGEATLTWQIKQEKADGQGYETQENGTITATVNGSDLITKLYGRPDLGALIPGAITETAQLEIKWHEPEAMSIDLKNHYDVTINLGLGNASSSGDDEFVGELALKEDGTWEGVVTGTATGDMHGEAFGEACSSSWDAVQQVLVVGREDPAAQTGDFTFTFTPLTDPIGPIGAGKCPPTRHYLGGIMYAPYNDYGVSQAQAGQGLTVVLPPRPGGHVRVPVPPLPAGSGITINEAYWDIDIQFLGP